MPVLHVSLQWLFSLPSSFGPPDPSMTKHSPWLVRFSLGDRTRGRPPRGSTGIFEPHNCKFETSAIHGRLHSPMLSSSSCSMCWSLIHRKSIARSTNGIKCHQHPKNSSYTIPTISVAAELARHICSRLGSF